MPFVDIPVDMIGVPSRRCIYCGAEFTAENPCWNDEGTCLEHEPPMHINGECKVCAKQISEEVNKWTS